MAHYLIVGMGRFGRSIAKTLYEHGQTVLAIDSKENIVQEVIDENVVYDAIAMDAKDELALRKIVEGSFDTAFVCVGTNIQDSILITLILKEMGVENIICKATSKIHGKVLEKIGANKIVYPEEEMGAKLAFNIMNPSILEYFKFSDEYSIMEVKVKEEFSGKTLQELDLRNKYGANIIAVKESNGKLNASLRADTILHKDDCMMIFGKLESMKGIIK